MSDVLEVLHLLDHEPRPPEAVQEVRLQADDCPMSDGQVGGLLMAVTFFLFCFGLWVLSEKKNR